MAVHKSSGADIAEAFDVTGNIKEYEAGDVLAISTNKDRAVEKSSEPYSTLGSRCICNKAWCFTY
jgi:hypothetical protein